jgi:protein-tyrosine phosphatase
LPIVDGSIPDKQFELEWKNSGPLLGSLLRRGKDVLVHCRGGLGRAGTIAAWLLIDLGMEPQTAIANVRKVRPGAIEPYTGQEEYVKETIASRK